MNKKLTRTALDLLYIIIGNTFVSFAVAIFYNPASIATGGATGIGIIINHITGFSLGLAILLINIPIYLLGLFFFGRTYGLKTIFSIVSLSVLTMIINKILGYNGLLDYSKEISYFLSMLYGGVLTGLGVGITMKSGANTGGTDIIAQIISRSTKISVGAIMAAINAIIIALSAFIFSLQAALLALIAVFIESFMVDKVILLSGTGYAKCLYIISEHNDEIGSLIIKELNRSGTIINATGLYSKTERPILMTIIPNSDLTRLVRAIKELDPKAFVIIESTFHVLGEGYRSLDKVADNQDVSQSGKFRELHKRKR